MSRKRPTEDPPLASSSEEENDNEDDDVGEEESSAEDDDERKNNAEEDKEDNDDDDEEEEKEEEEKTPLKKQKTESGKDGSDSESDSESEKSLPSPNVSDFTIKPIVTKPQKSAPISIPNPNPKPKPIATESSSQPRKPPSSASNGGAGNVKTPGGTRLWSEADEIAILKGMIEYKSKKGSDPYSDSSGFHDFIKQSIQADVSKNQLTEKIRRLKKKYQINAEKGQNGNDPVFSKPHDRKSFELSKKIWDIETNGKINKSQKKRKTSGSEEQDKTEANANGGITLALPSLKNYKETNAGISTQVSYDSEIEKEALWKDYPCLKESFEMGKLGNVGAFPMNLAEMVGVIGREKLKEIERELGKLKIEELKLFLKRLELVQEQARAVLDVIKGSDG